FANEAVPGRGTGRITTAANGRGVRVSAHGPAHWRRFDARRVALEDLSPLLSLTFGVHMTGKGHDGRELVFKTSPSGGACHPYEAYVLALRVEGLPRGLYHYASDTHHLNVLKKGASRRHVARYVPVQWWYESAAAV